jgi:hypothetical protein
MTRTRHPNFDKVTAKELAFSDQGVDYYHFPGGIPMYQERFVMMGETLRKHDQYKVTDGILTEHIAMLEGLASAENMTAKKLQMEVLFLADVLKSRRENSFWPMYHYQLASVWYFDEGEDPFGYSEEYGMQKIRRWLESPNRAEIFFFICGSELTRYMPSPDLSPSASLNYTSLTAIREYVRSQILLKRATSNGFEPGILKSIESQMDDWKLWSGLDASAWKPTTNSSANGTPSSDDENWSDE